VDGRSQVVANLGYHVNIVFFADTQMLGRGVIAFESLPELKTHNMKSGGKMLEKRLGNIGFRKRRNKKMQHTK